MKKLLAVFLSVLMMLSAVSVLVGCGGGGFGGGDLSGDALEERWTDDESKEYEIVYYMPYNGGKMPEDYKSVETELSKVLKKKINATIKLIPYLFSEYTQKLNGIMAANIEFDVCFTSPNVNPYATAVARECLEMIPQSAFEKYAPQTYANFDQPIWDQAKVDGKLYASINEQILPRIMSLQLPRATLKECYVKVVDFVKDQYPNLVEKYKADADSVFVTDGLDTNKILENLVEDIGMLDDTYKFIDTFGTWLENNEKGFADGGKPAFASLGVEVMLENHYKFDPLAKSMYAVGAVDTQGDTKKVVNQFASPQFKEFVDKTYEWKEKGWINGNNGSGKLDLGTFAGWKPSVSAQGRIFKTGTPIYLSNYITGTMNAISSTSKNPARALKFIELMTTDEEVHTLLQYGIKDKSYELDENNPNRIATFLPGGGYNNANNGWALGSEYIALLQPGQTDDVWVETEKINKETPLTPVVGFVPDLSRLSQKITDCTATAREFASGLVAGTYADKDKTMAEFLDRLNIAGANDIVQELQRQLDEFYANKAK